MHDDDVSEVEQDIVTLLLSSEPRKCREKSACFLLVRVTEKNMYDRIKSMAGDLLITSYLVVLNAIINDIDPFSYPLPRVACRASSAKT